MLTTVGRRSGEPRCVPVTVVREGDRAWLVAPYGPVAWVLNARAQGRISLSGRALSGEFTVTDVSSDDAGPVLKEYLQLAGAVRPYFVASKDSAVEVFVKEAHCHLV